MKNLITDDRFEKTFMTGNCLIINMVDLFDRTNDEDDKIWLDMCNHHCQYIRNGTLFELGMYFSFPEQNLNEPFDDENYDNTVGRWWVKKLREHGLNDDISMYDGIFVNVTW